MPAGRPRYIDIADIITDGQTQVRHKLDEATCKDYAEAMQQGEPMPPVDVFSDGSDFWLADGFHRLNAALLAGQKRISCHIYQGGREMAIWHAIGANRRNGLRLTNQDKRRAIAMALKLKPQISNRQIAEMVGVSHPVVADVRTELEFEGDIPQLDRLEDAAGRHQKAKPGKAKDCQDDRRGNITTSQPPRRSEIRTPDQGRGRSSTSQQEQLIENEEAQPDAAGTGQDAPVDRVGNPITDEGIADAFRRTDELNRLTASLRDIIRTVQTGIDTDDPLFADLTPVQIMADLNNAKNQIHAARPYAICPYCHGSGLHKGKRCPACYGRGWVGKIAYEHGKNAGGDQ